MNTDYSRMSSAEIADHIEADAHAWEWSVDENGNDVEPKYGADERYARKSSMPDSLMRLLGKDK